MVTLGTALAIIGAGLAVGLSAIGSGVGVGIVGSAGIGVSGDKPEKFGRAILFSAIPQTQAIYGLLVAIIILLKTGILFRNPVDLSLGTGIAALAAGVSVGFAGLSAIGQGVTASAGVRAIAEDDRVFGRAIVFSVVPETQAIYGLLMAIIILMYTGFLGAEIKDVPVEIAIAMLGAALSVGIAGTSAIGQGITAASGINAVMKNEGMFGRALVFSVLSETHAIFGLLVGFLILLSVGIFGNLAEISLGQALALLAAGISTGLGGISAIGLGITAAHGVRVVSEKERLFGRAIVFSIVPETQMIYALLVSILILVGIGTFGGGFRSIGLGTALAVLGAAFSVGFAASSAIGQGITAGEGISKVSENETIFGRALVFSVVPETQALYGLLTATLILFSVGLLGGGLRDISIPLGLIAIGAGLSVGIAGTSAIGQGITAALGIRASSEDPNMFGRALVFSAIPETQAIFGLLITIMLLAFGGFLGASSVEMSLGHGLAAIGAGLAVGFAGTSAIGLGVTAGYGILATKEKREMFGRSLIFSVIPETQAIYGLLIAVIILLGAGILGRVSATLPASVGLAALGAGVGIGIAGTSAIGQGVTAAYGISVVQRDEKMFGKALVFSAIPETQAIFSLLIAILILLGFGLVGGRPSIEYPISASIVAVGAGLAVGIASTSAIGLGVTAGAGIYASSEKGEMFGKSLVFSVVPETQIIYALLVAILALLGAGIIGGAPKDVGTAVALVAVGAGLSTGFAGFSAVGQGITAAMAVGNTLNNENLFGRSLIFSAIPETQAIYGLLIALILFMYSGIIGGVHTASITIGIVAIAMGFATGIAGLSAVGQGITAGNAINIIARRNEMFGKAILFSAIPETQAIYGLLTSILFGVSVGLFGIAKNLSIETTIAMIGGGLSIGLAGLSAIGQGITAAATINVMCDREGAMGRGLLFSVLSETFAIFGLLVVILILIGLSLL
ncbi:MAG: hypothetical protein J7K58_00870 [Euryarchaeota archaeon]|nr:hypothetical protein [Euryarchaeota archaeon]